MTLVCLGFASASRLKPAVPSSTWACDQIATAAASPRSERRTASCSPSSAGSVKLAAIAAIHGPVLRSPGRQAWSTSQESATPQPISASAAGKLDSDTGGCCRCSP